MKKLTFALAMAAVAFGAANAQVPSKQRPGTPVVMSGKIAGVIANGDTHILFRNSSGEIWRVNVGPTAYLRGLALDLRSGMDVTIDGFEIRPATQPTIMARLVYTDRGTFEIRETDGSLVWQEFVNEVPPSPPADPFADPGPVGLDEMQEWMWSSEDAYDLGGGLVAYGDGSVIQVAGGPMVLSYRLGSPVVSPGIRHFRAGLGRW